MDKKIIITIGRQYGSGGRAIGKLLSQIMGIGYYDKELMQEAARESGLCAEYFERADEQGPNSLMSALAMSFTGSNDPLSGASIFQFQSDAIRTIAEKESCVIVGRCADYVLREDSACMSVFIHAPIEECIKRVMETENIPQRKAQEAIEKKNRSRAAYYDFYTDKKWGASASYNLSIDSSLLGDEATAIHIRDFIINVSEKR